MNHSGNMVAPITEPAYLGWWEIMTSRYETRVSIQRNLVVLRHFIIDIWKAYVIALLAQALGGWLEFSHLQSVMLGMG
jgi:hypothetical protein